MKPFVKVGHRNGSVFLRLVHQLLGRRATTMVKLAPSDAKSIAEQMAECASRASGDRPKKAKKLRIMP